MQHCSRERLTDARFPGAVADPHEALGRISLRMATTKSVLHQAEESPRGGEL
jgi:hypothetical protein